MNPEFEDESPVNPFDFWEGANFKLKVRKVAGYINYDKSEFESASQLHGGDDAALEELWKNQYPLKEFTDPSNFKSYDELKARLETVLHGGSGSKSSAEDLAEAEALVDRQVGSVSPNKSADTASSAAAEDTDAGDSDDALSYFERLANEG